MKLAFLPCALALAVSVALAPFVKAADITPSVAPQGERESILVAVLEQMDFEGVPEPPPGPGQAPKPPAHKAVIVVDETYEICAPSAKPKCGPTEDPDLFLSKRLDARVPKQLRQELVAANITSARFECPRLKWVQCESAATISSIFRNGGWWDDFYRKYPKTAGVVHFSNVVLSHDGKSALLYITHQCDGLCGTGNLVLLQKTEGTWVVRHREQLWIS